MNKPKIISGEYFREHPFCIKSGTLVEFTSDSKGNWANGKRAYFDGYDTFGRRKMADYFDLYPVFKQLCKDGKMNRSRSFAIDPYDFTSGRYDLKIISEPEW